jgi:hypothetical protein
MRGGGMFKQIKPLAAKMRRKLELKRMLNLLVKQEVAEGLSLLAREPPKGGAKRGEDDAGGAGESMGGFAIDQTGREAGSAIGAQAGICGCGIRRRAEGREMLLSSRA